MYNTKAAGEFVFNSFGVKVLYSEHRARECFMFFVCFPLKVSRPTTQSRRVWLFVFRSFGVKVQYITQVQRVCILYSYFWFEVYISYLGLKFVICTEREEREIFKVTGNFYPVL